MADELKKIIESAEDKEALLTEEQKTTEAEGNTETSETDEAQGGTDWKTHARTWEKRAQDNDKRSKELEDELTVLREKIEDLKSLEAERTYIKKFKAAQKHGIPDSALDFLSGDSDEDLETSAQKLSQLLTSSASKEEEKKEEEAKEEKKEVNIVQSAGRASDHAALTLDDIIRNAVG